MGDSQNEIPRKVYEDLVTQWEEEIDRHHAEELLSKDEGLRRAIMDKAKELDLSNRERMKLIVAVEGFKDALAGKGIEKDLLPDDVSRKHIHDKPEETKSTVQRIALETLAKMKQSRSEGRGR